ncbi:hypothetical protein niasHS_014415 [Heterodera schachtii]|uniref:BAG domain-containing protein n=1 Tax=Heterodera schachtii TaxID=97005 RepID=A0ABD2ICL9_HETSC
MWLTIRYGAKECKIEVNVGGETDGDQQKQSNEGGEGKVEEQKNADEKQTKVEEKEEKEGGGKNEENGTDCEAAKPSEAKQKMPTNLGELRERICEETGYENGTMKLIHKGKYIVAPMDRRLAELKLKDGDRIVAIGVVATPKPASGVEMLANYEKTHLAKLDELYKTIGDDITELERNFLQGEMLDQMLKRMDKRVKEFTEAALRHLETIDALDIYPTGATEEQKCRCREKRKCMVDTVQTLLNENDKYTFRLEQYRKSLLYK